MSGTVGVMQHVRFGRTGLRVSRLCLGTMTFGYQCDDETSFAILDAADDAGITFLDTADAYPLGAPVELLGRTEEIVGRWMSGRRDRVRGRHEVLLPHWAEAVGCRQLAAEHHARRRGVVAPAAHRPHRPVPAALLGPGHADRRDPAGARRPRAAGQGPLHRLLELPRLPTGPLDRPVRGARHGAVRLGPAPLQPVVPRERTGAVPAVRRGRHRGDPVQPARRRIPLRQAPPRITDRGDPVHARPRRRAVPGALLARPDVRFGGGVARRSPTRPA